MLPEAENGVTMDAVLGETGPIPIAEHTARRRRNAVRGDDPNLVAKARARPGEVHLLIADLGHEMPCDDCDLHVPAGWRGLRTRACTRTTSER